MNQLKLEQTKVAYSFGGEALGACVPCFCLRACLPVCGSEDRTVCIVFDARGRDRDRLNSGDSFM